MLREFFIWLFDSNKPFEIDVFSFWHILYTLVIIATTILLGIRLSRRGEEYADKILSRIASTVVIIYLADFFVQPLMHGDASVAGEMNIDKLPFHICTLMCPVLAIVQSKKLKFLYEPAAFLAIVGPLMYLTYPNGALGDVSPLSYKILQTFIYHGLVLSWGYNMIASGKVKPRIQNCWKALVGLCVIAVWAALGNAVYTNVDHHYDWFFITGSSFAYAFPESWEPYLGYIMPFIVIVAIFAVVLAVYGIYYAVVAINEKRKAKSAA